MFKGAVACQYLEKQGLAAATLEDPSWTQKSADKVATAAMEWAKDHGLSVFTHWFQPQGASGVRHGLSSQVHITMFSFDEVGTVHWDLKGPKLLKGETDGSSYHLGVS